MTDVVQFILVNDVTRAKFLRRKLAEKHSMVGVVVGTHTSLLSVVQDTYLLPTIKTDWNKQFEKNLALTEGFWSESYRLAPEDTSNIVKEALNDLIMALPVCDNLNVNNIDKLPLRPSHHIEDLLNLYNACKETLDDECELLRQAITADKEQYLRTLYVHMDISIQNLTVWQTQLIKKINEDAGNIILPEYTQLFLSQELATEDSCLYALQTQLFESDITPCSLDSSVQFVGVRDYMEESDAAAGMVQEILQHHDELTAKDIALLLPDDIEYTFAVEDAFISAGIPLSGLRRDEWHRDLAHEALFHFLYCRQKPAPVMALSACLSSVLMPWSIEQGAELAQKVMDGDYRLIPPYDASESTKAMLNLINEGDDTPKSLTQALHEFVGLLNENEHYAEYVHSAKNTVQLLCSHLETSNDIPWKLLRRLATPKDIRTSSDTDFNLEGLTIWRENQFPWRRVTHLLVLGFSEGHYPMSTKLSSVFSPDDLIAIKQECKIKMTTMDEKLNARRQLFHHQLSHVSNFVNFFIPRLKPPGEQQGPSDSLVFMTPIFKSADNFILELDVQQDLKGIRYLAKTEQRLSVSPRRIQSDDLKFSDNLLNLRKDSKGKAKPESPSGLETLMVSPLAWLLNRMSIEEQRWSPEELDVMTQGTLAHYVFEKLFSPNSQIPRDNEIDSQARVIFEEGILKIAPYLRGNQWQIERTNLLSSIIKAANAWSYILRELNAEVLGSEIWLKGRFDGIDIHGQADAIIKLADGQLLVVDYKRSSSKSREPRMSKAYDSQANLYITMLNSNNSNDEENKELHNLLTESGQPGIVYYMLNDQTALSDFDNEQTHRLSGWDYIAANVSNNAMILIRKRLDEIKAGSIKLNRQKDEVFFEKQAGIKPYALKDSPLISLFTLADDKETVE